MNERIDELAFEAGCHRHKFWDPKHPDLEGFIISQAVLDKFAELLIQECMEQIDDGNSDHAGGNIDAINRIKEHFGVE